MLDDFVTDEVSERITERRTKVSGIWGASTTNSQSTEVRDFYREVKGLLSEALSAHLKSRAEEFGKFLVVEAEGAPRDALNEVQVPLDQAADNILAAAAAVVAGQKEAVQSLVDAINADCAESLRRAGELMLVGSTSVDDSNKLGALLCNAAEPAQVAVESQPPIAPAALSQVAHNPPSSIEPASAVVTDPTERYRRR